MNAAGVDFWRRQSRMTDPGAAASALDAVPADPDALTAVSAGLVFHYRGDGDWEANGIARDRRDEIDLCFAADAFARLLDLDPSLVAERPPERRILGCCRDFTNLCVAMLRHHGVAARSRVGFATYFAAGWWIDHVVAEVWDDGRWRRIDPQLRPSFVPDEDARDVPPLDRLDVGGDWFLTAPEVWRAARSGALGEERCVVMPSLAVPQTRGFAQIRHNLLHDLAALLGRNPVLWDDWGLALDDAPLAPETAATLDALAADTADPSCPLEVIRRWSAVDGLGVPTVVRRSDPLGVELVARDVDLEVRDRAAARTLTTVVDRLCAGPEPDLREAARLRHAGREP